MVKLLILFFILIIIGAITYNLVANYEPIKYELDTEAKVMGYCYKQTCYGIMTNNKTIKDLKEVIK